MGLPPVALQQRVELQIASGGGSSSRCTFPLHASSEEKTALAVRCKERFQQCDVLRTNIQVRAILLCLCARWGNSVGRPVVRY
ncbi:MAG TPA: hypothetical protein VGM17_03745, partial [Rhizomicrobium sp.]